MNEKPFTLQTAKGIADGAIGEVLTLRAERTEGDDNEGYGAPPLRKRWWTANEMTTQLRHMPSRSTLQDRLKDPEFPQGEQEGPGRPRLFDLERANKVREICGTSPRRGPGTRARTITITNQKGGVGKTTTACNVAHGCAIAGYRTLLIDMDSQASATAMFGLQANGEVHQDETIIPYMAGYSEDHPDFGQRAEDLTYAIKHVPHIHNLHIVPASTDLSLLDFKLMMLQKQLEEEGEDFPFYPHLRDAIATVADDYDVIIIDSPPNMSFTAINCLYAADGVIMPQPANPLDFDSARKCMEMIAFTYRDLFGEDYDEELFEWFRVLITKNQKPRKDNQMSGADYLASAIRRIYAPYVLEHSLKYTKVLEGEHLSTVYDHHPYPGSRDTYRRALDLVEGLVTAVEEYLALAWEKDVKETQQAAAGGAA